MPPGRGSSGAGCAGTWRRGFRWAAVEIGAVAVVLAAGAALPLTRHAFRDTRYRLGYGSALLTALVLVPVGTVLLEEVAFRGVLWGLLRRVRGTATATIVSSLLFGLWHVLPSLGLAGDNEAIGSASGKGGSAQVLTELGTPPRRRPALSPVGRWEPRTVLPQPRPAPWPRVRPQWYR
jgi:uncharacterized protein